MAADAGQTPPKSVALNTRRSEPTGSGHSNQGGGQGELVPQGKQENTQKDDGAANGMRTPDSVLRRTSENNSAQASPNVHLPLRFALMKAARSFSDCDEREREIIDDEARAARKVAQTGRCKRSLALDDTSTVLELELDAQLANLHRRDMHDATFRQKLETAFRNQEAQGENWTHLAPRKMVPRRSADYTERSRLAQHTNQLPALFS